MTRIDFYALKEGSAGDRFLLTCRLVERIHVGEGLRIYIQVPDLRQAQHLDRLLWTYKEQSFLPHGLMDQTDRELTPILIGHDREAGEENQVLINLSPEVPAIFERFQRLCEPVDLDPGVRSAGRERFRWYRDQGFDPHHHAIML